MTGLVFELELALLFCDWLLLFWSASLVMMRTPAELVEWKETTQGTKQSEESSNESILRFGQQGFGHCLWQLYGTRVVARDVSRQRFLGERNRESLRLCVSTSD